MHTILDRLYVDFQSGKWQVIAGRHRINWGMNLVWNPTDIFNTFSVFDFDYEERPGTDAVLVKYYSSSTSHLEVVYELADNLEESSVVGRGKLNFENYDVQLFTGYQKQYWVAGEKLRTKN